MRSKAAVGCERNIYYCLQQSCEGYVFTHVCLSTGGVSAPRGQSAPGRVCSRGVSTLGGGLLTGGVSALGGLVSQHALRQTHPRKTATAADGTHPTGMHSCSSMRLII